MLVEKNGTIMCMFIALLVKLISDKILRAKAACQIKQQLFLA